jgi:hypothetical protein
VQRRGISTAKQSTHIRSIVLVCMALVACVCVAACGSSKKTTTSTPAASSSTPAASSSSTPQATAATGGQAEAAAIVKRYETPGKFTVTPLTKRPPTGKTVVQITCTLPLCANNADAPAAKALGWNYKDITYDISKGPAAFNAAFDQALQDKPNYILAVGALPAAVSATQLNQAAQAHIPVGWIAGIPANPAIKVCANCAPYLAKSGALAEDFIVASYGMKAVALDYGDPNALGTKAYADGMTAEAKRLGAAAPIIDSQSNAAASPATNDAAVISYLQSHPNVNVVTSDFPDEIVGLPSALARVGLANKVHYVNTGPTAVDYGYVKSGTLAATVAIENISAWWRAIDQMARLSVGDPIHLYPSSWFQILTKSNITQALAAGGGSSEPADYQTAYESAWKVK